MPYHSLVLAFSQRQVSFQGYNLQEISKALTVHGKVSILCQRKILEFGLFVIYHLKCNRWEKAATSYEFKMMYSNTRRLNVCDTSYQFSLSFDDLAIIFCHNFLESLLLLLPLFLC